MTNTSHTQFDEYQKWTRTTASYPDRQAVNYCALGLGSEAGEVQSLIKKVIRDNDGIWTDAKVLDLVKELGDVIWYVARLSDEFRISFSEIMEVNIEKLTRRKEDGTIKGEGSDR